MKHGLWSALCLLAPLCCASPAPAGSLQTPPQARIQPVTDDYFGTEIVDNYRWMEAKPEPEFRKWLEDQNAYAHAVISAIPGRDRIERDIARLDGKRTLVLVVVVTGGKRFYLKRAAGSEIGKLFMSDAATGRETLLVDPETLGSKGSHAAIDQFAPSQDGSLVAYGVSSGGSEASVLHVMETASGVVRPDTIDRALFANVSWLPDGGGFFYTRLAKPLPGAAASTQFDHMRVYLHRLGADPDTDPVVLDADHLPFAFEAAQIWPTVMATPGSNELLAVISNGMGSDKGYFSTSLTDALRGAAVWKTVATMADNVLFATVRGDDIYLLTHKNSPNNRVVLEDLRAPNFSTASTVVEPAAGVITGIAASSEALYVAARKGHGMELSRLRYGSKTASPIPLPYSGTIFPPVEDAGALSADPMAPGALFALESWVRPPAWLSYDPATGAVTDTGIIPKMALDFSGYDTIETSVRAPDGVMVPLSIIAKHGIRRDRSHPTIVEGYGSFGIPLDPEFRPSLIAWLDRGGVYAVAHVRGGGELGESWHQAGMIQTKQNTITDFIACAEAMKTLGYTSAEHLAGQGASGGGITIGVAMAQRPDLFRAALIGAGGVDALRFEQMPVGPNLVPEYGSVKNPAQFPSLLKMDAYQGIKDGGRYPAVLLTDGFNDSRIMVWMPAKMTARLQAATSSGRPVLFRVDFDDGHGIGSSRSQADAKRADEFAFLLWQLGAPDYQIH